MWRVASPDDLFRGDARIRGQISAGPAMPAEEGDLGKLIMDLSAIGIPSTPNTFAVRVEGDSMIGAGINDGDIVILEKREAKPNEVVAALVDQQVTLKRLVIENGKALLRAENPKYDDIHPVSELKIQGVAVGLIRRL
jgi:repressor LexA